MKRIIKYSLLLVMTIGSVIYFTACDDKNDLSVVINPGDEIDEALDCKEVADQGGYSTFYKPEIGWVGDPMPFYNESDQTFYMFHLQDWRDGRVNDHPIYYTTTKDYASFAGFEAAIHTGNTIAEQDVFIGTGSFVKHNNMYYGFYTGHNDNLQPKEKIMLATSPDLKEWTKIPEFTFQAPVGYDENNFRDPHVYFDPLRNCYVMLITTIKDGRGCLARYISDDLMAWTNIEPFTEFEADAEILECPDIFKMGDKWYLTYSRINRDQHRKTFYRIADTPEGPWRTVLENGLPQETFDGLFLYAGKTASNGADRYISGWCSTGEKVNNSNELQWAGALISHKIVQAPSGRLYAVIPDAMNNKFVTESLCNSLLKSGSVSETADGYNIGSDGKVVFNRNGTSCRITMTIDASAANKFGIALGACDEQDNINKLELDLTNNHWGRPCVFMYNNDEEINFTTIDIPDDRKFNITLVIEKSVCTMYINGKTAFTNRIYKMYNNPWMIYSAEGTTLFTDIKIYK